MRFGIDATSLARNHGGGKEQVLLNLLKGLSELGLGKNYVIFCYDFSVERIHRLIPEATTVVLKELNFPKKLPADMIVKSFFLPKEVKAHGIDVLLFPMPNTGLALYRIPTAVIPHDLQVLSKRFGLAARMKYGFVYSFDFALRSVIIAISSYDYHEISMRFPKYRKRLKQIYNPIRIPNVSHTGGRTKDIVAINIRYVHKNTETLIRAFKLLDPFKAYRLVLIGELKEETAYLKKMVKELGLEDRVEFTGFLPEANMYERLSGAALYVNPSLYEGFGMTAVEAMMMGVPTLISNVGAAEEVTQGLCSYYEPPEDVNELAEAMKVCLDEPPKNEALEGIRDMMCAAYDYRTIAKTYHEMLEALTR